MNTVAARDILPDHIARRVVLPAGYTEDRLLYDAFAWIRRNKPLAIAEVAGYDPLWIVSKHADILHVSRDPHLFHNADHNPILMDQATDAFTRSMNNGSLRVFDTVTFMDPPEHAKYRNVVSSWFLPGRILKMEAAIRRIARESVAELMAFDGECDFVKDFALYYPLRVILELMGIDRADEARMLRLTQEFFGSHDPEIQRTEFDQGPDVQAQTFLAAIRDFYAWFNELTESRRGGTGDDFITLIANAKVDGDYMPERFASAYHLAFATAGHDTTSSSSSAAILGMIEFPEQFAKVKADPSLIPALVDEGIRWASPVKHFMRNATHDTELRGQKIRAGDRLMLCYPSGNRDEDVFENPDVFDIGRGSNRHVSFGYGPHMCVGQHLARLELRILFEELMPMLKSVELAGQPQNIQTNFVGGLKSLPIRFAKA
ncbi:MAG: cytochrome P450 [Sphingomonadaceae bacterium]